MTIFSVGQEKGGSRAESILACAQADRVVIQDFCPLAQSIEWQLGQQYMRERGSKVFISDSRPVPYVINNDGVASRNAAELLFVALTEAEKSQTLPASLFVL